MKTRLLAIAASALAAILTLTVPALSAQAAPRPDNPSGATIALAGGSFAAGATISFSGTGWTTTASSSSGAVIGGVKLDDTDQLNASPFTATADGAVSGSVTLPAGVAPGEHWLRFLSGSDQPGDPVRSLHATFTVAAAASDGTGATADGSGATGGGTAGGSGTTADGNTAIGGSTGGGADAATLPKTGIDIADSVWISAGLLVAAAVLGGWDARRRRRRQLQG